MIKKFLFFSFAINLFAHPVSYTIDLEVSYDVNNKTAKILCSSNSKNKCGLYDIRLLDSSGKIITQKKFPFLKKSVLVKSEVKPYKLEFYLRKIPEHKYNKIFD